jgi:broad specificity phosphatase PhoE
MDTLQAVSGCRVILQPIGCTGDSLTGLPDGVDAIVFYKFQISCYVPKMRAIVVRHYKTLLNTTDQIIGWGDAPRAKGWRADLAFVNNRLRECDIELQAIYSSDLERARQTAMYFAKCHGIRIVNDSALLNEVNYGALYKKSKKWVASNIPQHKVDPDYVYPDGESFRQMQNRSVSFLASLAGLYPERTILLVVHAGVIRGFVSHFLGLDYAGQLKRKLSHRYIGDFHFRGHACVRYDELGKRSGFVRDGAVQVPCSIKATTPVNPVSREGIDTGTQLSGT